jgi:hypothetical protein
LSHHTTHIPKLHLDFVKADTKEEKEREKKTSHEMPENSQSLEILHQKSKVPFLKNICSKKETVNPVLQANNLIQCSVHWSW